MQIAGSILLQNVIYLHQLIPEQLEGQQKQTLTIKGHMEKLIAKIRLCSVFLWVSPKRAPKISTNEPLIKLRLSSANCWSLTFKSFSLCAE